MTYPTNPPTAYDYVTFQAGNPTDPLPANEVASDFADHKLSIDQIIAFSKLIQRSDGNLQNGVVHPESLSSGVLALLSTGATFRGAWLTATAYVVNNIVAQNGFNYICIVAHTSGVFATDLAAGKWQLVDGGNARLAADQTFTGANTFSGAVDMTAGTPTVPTASPGDNDMSAASTAFVTAALTLATGKVYTQVFIATGTYTPHAGMINCIIECWGGGGGGGGTATGAANVLSIAGAGGAGGYSRKLATAATVGASKAVTIGTAGTAGTAGNNAGGAGGDTSVGALCIGKGGSGGAGSAGALNTLNLGGLGGVAGTGDVLGVGAPGSSYFTNSTTSVLPIAGNGGSSAVGGGGRGLSTATAATGEAATGKAAGGSAGASYNAGGTAAGGAGTAGYVVITEFCNQ